ncbi:MAG: hypothetical protein OQJ84_09930, partial [Xanthomonadales bacterium]|nr:hypothetical protein [Xanthomonadales bacterium]
GGWASASVALSGNKDIIVSQPGTYLFTLRCVGDSGTVQSQLSVTAVTDTPPPDNCAAATLGGTTVEWAEFWNDVPFPDPVYGSIYSDIPRNGYLAIKFNTADFVDTGLLSTIETTATRGRRLGALSQCPGDFDVADECQEIWGNGGDIIWTTDGYSGACDLEPNTTYYFNITFTDGVDPTTSECTSTYCQTKVRAKNP